MAFFASLRRFNFFTDHSCRLRKKDEGNSSVLVYQKATRRIPLGVKIVTVATDVVEIPKKSFFKKQHLSRVDFSQADLLCTIGEAAFANAKSLIEIHLPHSLESLQFEAFSQCTRLRRVRLNSNLLIIGHSTFLGCRELQSMDFTRAKKLEVIGAYALSCCSSLITIQIPPNVKEIKHSAFLGCKSLKEARFRNAYIVEIPQRAFEFCCSLRLLNFGSVTSITIIQVSAFESCTSLETVTLPPRLQILEERSFFNCRSLAEVHFPDSLKKINALAFYSCDKLKTVTLPASLTSLGEAFDERYIRELGIKGHNIALCIRLHRLHPDGISFDHILSSALRHPEALDATEFLMPPLSHDEEQQEQDLMDAIRLDHVNAIWILIVWCVGRGIM